MWPIVTDSTVVGRSVTIASHGKITEPIGMPFGVWTRVVTRNHGLDGVHTPCEVAILSGNGAVHYKV